MRRSSVAASLLAVLFAVWDIPSPAAFAQSASSNAVADYFESAVYGWLANDTVLKLSPGRGLFVQAHVNPNGGSVVFWGGNEGRPRVWRYDFAQGRAVAITPAETAAVEPAFDWSGQRVVFASDRSSSAHIDLLEQARAWKARAYGYSTDLNLFVATASGDSPKQLTSGPFKDTRPSFSPDGSQVVFLSNRGGGGNGLYVVSVDGSGSPRQLIPDRGIGRPWFSADGKWIYFFFSNLPDDHQRIFRVAATGGSWEPVTPDGLPRSHGPFADPDGVHLWFHSTKGDDTTPYQFNLRTKELRRVMPPRFATAGHITRSRNNVYAFDSTEPNPLERK